jgi:hypothetical protein
MTPRILAPLVAALAAAAAPAAIGAAQLPDSARAEERLLTRAVECCDDPAQFSFADATLPGRLEFTVDPRSPLFEFQSGRSFFKSLRLPAGAASYRVRIRSLLRGGGDRTRVFYPVVALLDENFIVTRVSSLDHLRLEPGLATPGGSSALSLTVRIDPKVAVERYLVVFTPAVLLGDAPTGRRDGDVVTDPTLDYLQRKGEALIPPAAFGEIQVSLIPEDSAP